MASPPAEWPITAADHAAETSRTGRSAAGVGQRGFGAA